MRQYYASRKGPTVAELGEKYWTKKTDPDGRRRTMTSRKEGARKVAAMHEEIVAIAAEHRRLMNMNGRNLSALDVGCGMGWAMRELAAWGIHAEGVEPDCWAASHVQGDVWQTMPTTYSYDAALCYHVIEHVSEPVPFLESVLRTLKPGGLLVIGTPDFDSPGARKWGKRFRMLHDPTHVSLFSTRSLCAMLEDYGARIERVHYPEPPKQKKARKGKWSPPMLGNIVTVYARRGSPAEETAAFHQRGYWEKWRRDSDLLGVARELVGE